MDTPRPMARKELCSADMSGSFGLTKAEKTRDSLRPVGTLFRIGWSALVACLLGGCALQAMGGTQVVSPAAFSIDLGGRLVGTRTSGAYAGGDVIASLPQNGTLGVRQVIATGGYRHLFAPFSLEVGADLGAGQPASVAWGGTGVYLGASSALLLRLAGNQDSELGYLPGGYLIDALLFTRGGMWGRPAADPRNERGELAFFAGFRVTAISDIVVSDNDNWRP